LTAKRGLQVDPNDENAIFVAVEIEIKECNQTGDAQTCNDAAALGQRGLAIPQKPAYTDDNWRKTIAVTYPYYRTAIALARETTSNTETRNGTTLAEFNGSASGSDQSLAALESDIAAGKEVSIPIKFRNYMPHNSQYTQMFCYEGPECGDPQSVAANLYDAVVKLSKTSFSLSGDCRINRGFLGWELCDFQVPPTKLIGIENQPERASRLHVQVAIKNKKNDKEKRKDYYFYNAAAIASGSQYPGGEGTSFICSDCDDSMDVLYTLLTKFRGGQWTRIEDAPEPVAPPPPPTPPSAQRQYDDIAPPPPLPAPAPTIAMGQTKSQVIAAFGEPQRKATAGPKEIFFYTDLKMKVTFTNGKVSSIE
jgi:hypothetical protein